MWKRSYPINLYALSPQSILFRPKLQPRNFLLPFNFPRWSHIMCRIFETVTCLSNIFNLESRKSIFLPISSTTMNCLIWYQISQHFHNMRLTMAIGKCKSGHIMIRGGMCSPTRPQQVHYYSISREELNSQFLYNENFNRKMQDKSKVLVYNLFSYVKWIVPYEHRSTLDFHVSDPYCYIIYIYEAARFRVCIMCLKLFPNC